MSDDSSVFHVLSDPLFLVKSVNFVARDIRSYISVLSHQCLINWNPSQVGVKLKKNACVRQPCASSSF